MRWKIKFDDIVFKSKAQSNSTKVRTST